MSRIGKQIFLIAAVGMAGCGDRANQQLSAESFLAKPALEATTPVKETHELPKSEAHVTPATLPAVAVTTLPVETPSAANAPTADIQPDLYMTVGAVVVDVNGTPIYAHTILSLLNKEFAAKAKEMSVEAFRDFAKSEIEKQREQLINDELEYAAALRELTTDDRKIVDVVTEQFYRQKITEAGGSLEFAKRKAKSEGVDFDEMMKQQKRKVTRDLFYQRKIFPRAQVTRADMVVFYNRNLKTLFSGKNQAQFRVIKIDPARIGGADAKAKALEKIQNIRHKALRGDDFVALASTENEDKYLKAQAGDPGGWKEKGSYVIEPVENAVWKLQPGQITDVVEYSGAFYIAKLENKQTAKIRPFDDPAVQDEISARLFQEQFAKLRFEYRNQLLAGAVIIPDESQPDLVMARIQPVLDMAMQEYPQWR